MVGGAVVAGVEDGLATTLAPGDSLCAVALRAPTTVLVVGGVAPACVIVVSGIVAGGRARDPDGSDGERRRGAAEIGGAPGSPARGEEVSTGSGPA